MTALRGEPESGPGSGQALLGYLLSSVPAVVQQVLHRCVVAGVFDAALFTGLLAPEEVSLDQLLARRLVEQTDPGSGRYRVPRHLAEESWRLWRSGAAAGLGDTALRELSADIADYYAAAGQPVERLRHLVVAAPGAAEALFDELFRSYESSFRLARCQDILDVLSDPRRQVLLSEGLSARWAKAQPRLWSRTMWAADYQKTGGNLYLQRPELQGRLMDLLRKGESAPWLLRIHGGGGMGKTTLLRWFISRGCLSPGPAPNIACARIDVGSLDPVIVLDHPWLLLVEAAHQLDSQLESVPFREFREEFGALRWLLRRLPDARSLPGRLPTDLRTKGERVISLFRHALSGAGPALIVLDTLDRCVTLTEGQSSRLAGLVDLLVQLHKTSDRLKVVLAGRYDLSVKVPEIADLGPASVEVSGFTGLEAIAYLRGRGVLDDGLVAAAVGRSHCQPLVLGLLGDLLTGPGSELTPDEISRMSEPIIEYLALRILGQIPDPVVRWSLWYCMVPPALTFEFFREVMLPVLREGTADLDRVRTEMDERWRGDDTDYHDDPWQVPDPSDRADISARWHDIALHARTATWLDVGPNAESIVVNDEILAPLRAVVSEHLAYTRLHQRAVNYYVGRLGYQPADPSGTDMWPRWQRAAIFHQLNIHRLDGMARWRDAVGTSRSRGRLGWAREITEGLLADFDPGAEPGPSRILLSADRYEAHVQLARIVAEQAGQLPGPPAAGSVGWRTELSLALDHVYRAYRDAVGEDKAIGVLPYAPILLSLQAVEEGGPAERVAAITRLETLAGLSHEASRDRYLVLARSHIASSAPMTDQSIEYAEQAYLAAYRSALDAGSGVVWVAARAARTCLAAERFDRAVRWCERASGVRYPSQDASDGARDKIPAMHASALLALGRPGAALEVLAEPLGEFRSIEERCIAAECQLALRRPAVALDELAVDPDLDAAAGSVPSGARVTAELLCARAHGELLDLAGAEQCFLRAQGLVDPDDAENLARIAIARAGFEADVVGDLRAAAFHLGAEFDSLSTGHPVRIELDLARADLARLEERARDAVRILDDCHARAFRPTGSRALRLASCAAQLLAGSLLPAERLDLAMSQFLDQLEALPADARAGHLGGLRLCPEWPEVSGSRERVHMLFPLAGATGRAGPEPEPESDDAAWFQAAVAELYRVVGDVDTATRLRGQAARVLAQADPFIHWELLDADSRIGTGDPEAPNAAEFVDRYEEWPGLAAAFLTEWVIKYDPSGRAVPAQQWMGQAEGLLARWSARPSVRHLRFMFAEAGRERAQGRTDRAELHETALLALGGELGTNPRSLGYGVRSAARSAAQVLLVHDEDGGNLIRVRRLGLAGLQPADPGFAVPAERVRTAPGVDLSVSEWGRAAGAALGGEIAARLAPARADRAAHVQISFGGSSAAALPWELVEVDQIPLVRHPSVAAVSRRAGKRTAEWYQARFLHRALEELGRTPGPGSTPTSVQRDADADWPTVDGILAELGRRARARPLRVRLVLSGATSLHMLRRAGNQVGRLVNAYESAFARSDQGPTALRLSVSTEKELSGLMAGRGGTEGAVDVIHVCAVMESTEYMPVLGFDAQGMPPLSAADADQLVRRLAGTAAPVVVLDIQPPPGIADSRRQLVMRNQFAHKLLALGTVDTIIATGLDAGRGSAQLAMVAGGFAEGLSVVEICRRIQRFAPRPPAEMPDSPESDVLAFSGTALFSGLPADFRMAAGLLV